MSRYFKSLCITNESYKFNQCAFRINLILNNFIFNRSKIGLTMQWLLRLLRLYLEPPIRRHIILILPYPRRLILLVEAR